jgi:DNA-binding SARP family transcriptional activator
MSADAVAVAERQADARTSRATRLTVRLFGRIEVAVDDRPVPLVGRHAQALAALLALTRRPRSRDAIAADLWPEALTAANGALRQALWLLRSAFVAASVDARQILEADADALGLAPDLELELDVARFDEAMTAEPPDVETAIATYRGELVECLGHDCFARERERLADAFEDALAIASEKRLLAHDLAGAREAAHRLVARDPIREEAHAVLLRIHGIEGRRSQVLRQYRRLRDLLRRELDVDPLPETEAALRAALRDSETHSAEAVLREALRAPMAADGGPDTRPS